MPGLKAAGCRARRLTVIEPGWRAVWLLPGPEGCKVEPSLCGGGLGIGGAGLGSGGWGASSLGKEP